MRWRLKHRPALDGIRGLAILLVILGHVRIPAFDGGGWTGVTLFFVLSGFLITLLLLEERSDTGRISFRAFYRRRTLRLLPALGVVLVVLLAWRLSTGEGNAWRDTAGVALYSANWLQIITGEGMGLEGHTWSLAVEEQYYLLWPALLVGLLALPFARPRTIIAFIVAGALVSVISRLILYGGPADYERVYMGTDTRADALLAGSALAAWFHFRGAWRPGRPTLLAAVAVLVLIGAPPAAGLQRELVLFGLPTAVLAATVLVARAASGPLFLLDLRPLRAAGRISYGLYLWHLPVIAWVVAAFTAAGSGGLAARLVGAGIAVLVAMASYRYVERPFLRRKGRRRPSATMPRLRAGPESEIGALTIEPASRR